MRTITLDLETLNGIDLSSLEQYAEWSPSKQYLNLSAGKEHYKLIAYLANELQSEEFPLYDIGTYTGLSALALSFNQNQKVVTYDVCDWIPDESDNTLKKRENIVFKLMNCCNEIEELCASDLIILDIDPHDGVEERVIIDKLIENGFKGILILDDIHLNKDMEDFWKSIEQKKYDVTTYGHWSGTGLVIFDDTKFEIYLRK